MWCLAGTGQCEYLKDVVGQNQNNRMKVIKMDYSQNYRPGYEDEYEQKIDLRDMVYNILYKWRSLLLVAAVVCVLAGGYAVRYNKIILPEERNRVQEQLEEQYRLVKEGEEKGESIEQAQQQVKQSQDKLEDLKEYSLAKYCGIGFCGGLFVMIICYGTSYLFSDKMRGERELKDRYGYPLLGTFPRRHKSKFMSGIDHFLEKKEGISGQLTQEEACCIISVNITNFVKSGGTFLVTGTVSIEIPQDLTNAILPQLEENVALMTGADMNINATTLEALAECDGVILVEERDHSLRAKIQRECESIVALKRPVVGYVVM